MRTSLQCASARGKAADTSPKPPALISPVYSGVTNNTFFRCPRCGITFLNLSAKSNSTALAVTAGRITDWFITFFSRLIPAVGVQRSDALPLVVVAVRFHVMWRELAAGNPDNFSQQ